MKRVVSKHDVAHKWANKLQNEAYIATRNFYFIEDVIYSYGSHFPIAAHSTLDTICFTTRTYSNSTSKHISMVSAASSHLKKIYCENPKEAISNRHRANLESFGTRIELLLRNLRTARKPEKYLEPAKAIYEQCKIYCEHFNIDVPDDVTDLISISNTEEYKQYLINEEIKIQAEKERRFKKEKALADKNIKAWKAGKLESIWNANEIYFRLKGNKIETSKNVLLSKTTAMSIYKKLKAGKFKKGDSILQYTLKDISENRFIIACHVIYFKTCEAFIKKHKL